MTKPTTKAVGAAFERQVDAYISKLIPTVSPRAHHGDLGDLWVGDWILQCKAQKQLRPHGWLADAQAQSAAARKLGGLVVAKNYDDTDIGHSFVIADLYTIRDLLACDQR